MAINGLFLATAAITHASIARMVALLIKIAVLSMAGQEEANARLTQMAVVVI